MRGGKVPTTNGSTARRIGEEKKSKGDEKTERGWRRGKVAYSETVSATKRAGCSETSDAWKKTRTGDCTMVGVSQSLQEERKKTKASDKPKAPQTNRQREAIPASKEGGEAWGQNTKETKI